MARSKSIRFNADEVRASLKGRMTEMWVPVELQPRLERDMLPTSDVVNLVFVVAESRGVTHHCGTQTFVADYAPYHAGDELWVKEGFYVDHIQYSHGKLPKRRPDELDTSQHGGIQWIFYEADGHCCEQIPECMCGEYKGGTPWRSSARMPRWASRLELIVASVRVRRLLTITDKEAAATGVKIREPYGVINARLFVSAFAGLWESRYAKKGYSFGSDPWVWQVKFTTKRLAEAG